MTDLYESGIGHSALNTVRSALSTFVFIDGQGVGKHPLVIRFLRGVFNENPVFPKKSVTWDPEILLTFLKKLSPVRLLNLKLLTFKTVTLLLLLTAQRLQSVHLIHIKNIRIAKGKLKISFGDQLKTTRPGFHQKEIVIPGFAPFSKAILDN